MTETATTAAATTSAPAPEQVEQVEFSVQDLMTLKTVIDLASQRGAFKPGEMVTVGNAYNKLSAFLAAVAQQQSNKNPEQNDVDGDQQ